MNTDEHGFNLPEGELTHAIIGAAFEVLNPLRITALKVGLILNFKKPKLEWERIVL